MKFPAIGFALVRGGGPGEAYPNRPSYRWDGNTMRSPKKGERFLSGAIVHAHKARNDMDTQYFIAVKAHPGEIYD